jgi:ABC-type glycerol-3-phosphate transport system permease component
MTISAGKKLTVRIVPLSILFCKNGTTDTYRVTILPDVVFALLLAVVTPSFASFYTVDYAVQAAVVVVTIPLVLLILVFQHGVVSGLTAGTIAG